MASKIILFGSQYFNGHIPERQNVPGYLKQSPGTPPLNQMSPIPGDTDSSHGASAARYQKSKLMCCYWSLFLIILFIHLKKIQIEKQTQHIYMRKFKT